VIRYRVRPGYGSPDLLIEFLADADDRVFLDELFAVLAAGGARHRGHEDLVLLAIVHLRAPFGRFTLEVDDWNSLWIHAEADQAAIAAIDGLLQASPAFEKQDVDFAEYA